MMKILGYYTRYSIFGRATYDSAHPTLLAVCLMRHFVNVDHGLSSSRLFSISSVLISYSTPYLSFEVESLGHLAFFCINHVYLNTIKSSN